MMLCLPIAKNYSGVQRSGKKEYTCNSHIVKSNNGSKESQVIQSNQDVHVYAI